MVSSGGRLDLAMEALPSVRAATSLIVGGCEAAVIEVNRAAYEELICIKRLAIVEGATQLFNAPGKLDEVAELAALWHDHHLA